jgi:CRISPR/Cas system-associated exonuclease Cas4 (RecB family)
MWEKSRAEKLAAPHSTETWLYYKVPTLRFRASEAGYCERRVWYRLVGQVPQPDSPFSQRMMMQGNVQQDVVRSLFRSHGVNIGGIDFRPDGEQVETIVERGRKFEVDGKTIVVSARADGDFPDMDGALFEFKTMDHMKDDWLCKQWHPKKEMQGVLDRLETKHPDYMAQMQMTMQIFDRDATWFGHFNRNFVRYGIFGGIDGNPSKKEAKGGVLVKSNPEQQQQILERFAGIQDCVESATPPPPILDGSKPCSYCPFYYACHGAVRAGKVMYPE